MNPDVKKRLRPEEWKDYLGFMGYACVHKALDTSGVDRLVTNLSACRAIMQRIKKKCVTTRRALIANPLNLDRAFKNIMEIEKIIAAQLKGVGE